MKYTLKRPCPHCPFRTDVPGYLRRGRASEIALAIAQGSAFACHETTVLADDEDEMVETEKSQQCAGALICMEHEGMPNQVARVAERLGVLDPTRLDMEAPVHRSLAAFVLHHGFDESDEEEDDCCSICDFGCEAPAGMLVNGVAVPIEPDGEVHACPSCGESVCDSCSNSDDVCQDCSDSP